MVPKNVVKPAFKKCTCWKETYVNYGATIRPSTIHPRDVSAHNIRQPNELCCDSLSLWHSNNNTMRPGIFGHPWFGVDVLSHVKWCPLTFNLCCDVTSNLLLSEIWLFFICHLDFQSVFNWFLLSNFGVASLPYCTLHLAVTLYPTVTLCLTW
jgi:hypothetical protein